MIKTLHIDIVTPLLAIILGLIVGAIVMLVFGYDPIQNYLNLFSGAFGDAYSIGETLRNAIPLMLTGLGFSITNKIGFFNIGGSGQYLFGWLTSIMFVLKYSNLPSVFLISGAIIIGSISGGFWSWIAGYLRAYFGTNEVITTIMQNYIALYIVNFAIKKWLVKKGNDSSANIPKTASLRSEFFDKLTMHSTFHWGFFIAILVVIVLWLVLKKTTLGFEIRSFGKNQIVAKYSGMNTIKITILSMFLAGTLAGLAGALDGLGNFQNISVSNALPEIGFNGIAVALLANDNPIGMIFSSIFFSALQVGGMSISVYSTTPIEIVNIVIGSILFFVSIKYLYELSSIRNKRLKTNEH